LQRSFNLIRQLSRTYQISLVVVNLQGDSETRLGEYSQAQASGFRAQP